MHQHAWLYYEKKEKKKLHYRVLPAKFITSIAEENKGNADYTENVRYVNAGK